MRKTCGLVGVIALLSAFTSVSVAQTKDAAALRRKCAHAVKVRMNVKETGSADDLKGVRGAVFEVDRCVANGGKL